MERIFVTGLGVITSIGDTLEENRTSLTEGKCGVRKAELLDTRYTELLPLAEIKQSDEQLKDKFGIAEKTANRTSLISLHAMDEAIEDARLNSATLTSEKTALINANTVGGMSFTNELYHDARIGKDGTPYLYDYVSYSVTEFLREQYGMTGLINTINTACSSSANSIMYGARLIQHGFADRAIVGGADCLSKFTVNGFNALHILSSERCRPFDKSRNGLNLGEGAAFLILEKESDCKGKNIYAELTGYCNANDAHHPSALSDEGVGPTLVMEGALKMANLKSVDIGFINAHGTGTENNDLVESRAIKKVFESVPPFASSKSNIGHTLGASGAVEAVYSILSLYHQELYPHLHFENPIEETGLTPLTAFQKSDLRHVMSNSFGFGGNCSSLIFSKV